MGTGCVIKIKQNGSPKEQYTVIVYGDVDGDGTISVLDLISIKRHLLKQTLLTGNSYISANVDREANGSVNVIDLLKVKKHLLKMIQIRQN
ncbi:MAG: hypothetical protein BGN88_04690 [Clostridiales bacterium 43-6]|nr:MAG: hypothetical protein BGN88_04690 [Clostridiales bacterium 43-6]